jgi:hypothetical protein
MATRLDGLGFHPTSYEIQAGDPPMKALMTHICRNFTRVSTPFVSFLLNLGIISGPEGNCLTATSSPALISFTNLTTLKLSWPGTRTQYISRESLTQSRGDESSATSHRQPQRREPTTNAKSLFLFLIQTFSAINYIGRHTINL